MYVKKCLLFWEFITSLLEMYSKLFKKLGGGGKTDCVVSIRGLFETPHSSPSPPTSGTITCLLAKIVILFIYFLF